MRVAKKLSDRMGNPERILSDFPGKSGSGIWKTGGEGDAKQDFKGIHMPQ